MPCASFSRNFSLAFPIIDFWKIVQYISLIKPDAVGEDNPNGDFYTTSSGRQYAYYDGAGMPTFANALLGRESGGGVSHGTACLVLKGHKERAEAVDED